jgi:hypothetical protein
MAHSRKQETLPDGMALVQTSNGKWFHAFSVFSVRSYRVWELYLLEESPVFIPLALPPFHDPAQGYDSREEAIEACYAWREAVELPQEWRGLAARTEIYPERTAWYMDEIAHLTRGYDIPRLHCGTSVHAVVLVRQATRDNGAQIIAATGDTPDEAIETLYQRVYEWSRESQAIASAISTRVV